MQSFLPTDAPSFSPTDAAFEGFRFTRERPGAVAAWAGATLAFNVVSGLLGALIGGSTLVEFQSITQTQPFDWAAFAAMAPRLAPALAVTVAINVAGSAVIYPSAVRSFMGLDRRVTFRAGEDERRILLLLLMYGLIYFVVSSVTGICIGFLENIFAAFGIDTSSRFARFIIYSVSLIPPSVVIIRLLLAPIIAVDRKRISLKESWVSTKGHFWPLAGSLFMSILLYFLVVFVGLLLVMTLAQILSLSTHGAIGPGTLTGANQTSLADLITPAAIFSELIAAVMVAMLLPVLFGPLVRAYQAYDAPDGPAGAFFDTEHPVTLRGQVTAFLWLNAIAYIELEIMQPSGVVAAFRVKCAGPDAMEEGGWDQDMIKPGARLTVVVAPARNGAASGLLQSATLEDGRAFKIIDGGP